MPQGWHFVHAPGVDEPLVGFMRREYHPTALLVSDRSGRQFVAADSAGVRFSSDNDGLWGYHRYAGGTQKGSTFGADRFASDNAAQVSFFRNRAYDQSTGRWLQEDPIGVAGGLNLYQFNGNNPVTFTDPFGLKECERRGNCTQSDIGDSQRQLEQDKHGDGTVDDLSFVLTVATLPEGGVGGEVRGAIAGAKYVISEGLEAVTRGFTDKALTKTYTGAINQINRHKEILAKALPEQVNSIMKDIVKHEKRLQAAIEEMARRGIDPP